MVVVCLSFFLKNDIPIKVVFIFDNIRNCSWKRVPATLISDEFIAFAILVL